MDEMWEKVAEAMKTAKAITWEGCHKIYLAMDDGQVLEFNGYGYDLYAVNDIGEAVATVEKWYEESCGLRFVSAVSTNEADPNAGFERLIPQGAEDEVL